MKIVYESSTEIKIDNPILLRESLIEENSKKKFNELGSTIILKEKYKISSPRIYQPQPSDQELYHIAFNIFFASKKIESLNSIFFETETFFFIGKTDNLSCYEVLLSMLTKANAKFVEFFFERIRAYKSVGFLKENEFNIQSFKMIPELMDLSLIEKISSNWNL